jgi:aminoglycoside phosphotransferase (APT) family kinase protein
MLTGIPDQEIPGWVTRLLQEGGTLDRSRVTSVEVEELTAGMTGRVARLRLAYDTDGAGPSSLIGKFPSAHDKMRGLARQFRLYEREARFYQTIARRVAIPTPQLHGVCEVSSWEFILLLEDLEPARAAASTVGLTRDVVEELLLHLAQMHATWWASAELEALEWLPTGHEETNRELFGAVSEPAWRSFLENYGEYLPPSLLQLADKLKSDQSIFALLAAQPRTLVHGDCRWNNLLFSHPSAKQFRALIDWQTVKRARPAGDVACLLVNCLPVEDRRAAERELVPHYHDVLRNAGAVDYSVDAFWLDYRLEVLSELVENVIWSYLNIVGERGQGADEAEQAANAVRLFAAVDDLELVRLVSGRTSHWMMGRGAPGTSRLRDRWQLRSARKERKGRGGQRGDSSPEPPASRS